MAPKTDREKHRPEERTAFGKAAILPLVLVIGVLVLSPVVSPIAIDGAAANSTVTVDDFEDGDITVATSNWNGWYSWSDTTPPAEFEAVSSTSLSGSYSGRLNGTNGDINRIRLNRTLNTTSVNSVTAEMQISAPPDSAADMSLSDSIGFVLLDFDKNTIARVKFRMDGTILDNQGNNYGSWTNATTYTPTFDNFNFASGSVDVEVNGNTNTIQMSSSEPLREIYFHTDHSDSSFNSDLYLDDLTVDDPNTTTTQSGDISGTVETQDGDPVPNATVNILQVNRTELEQQGHTTGQELLSRANELRDRVDDVRPDDFCDADLLSSSALCNVQSFGSTSPSDLDQNYVAVHDPGEWVGDVQIACTVCFYEASRPNVGISLPNPPTFQFDESPARVAVSVWDPSGESLVEDGIDADLHGETTSDDVVITEIGADGSSIQSETVETRPLASGGLFGKTHEVGITTLGTGLYRVEPEGGGASYYIKVGNPISEMGDQLQDQADALTNRAEWIRDNLNDNTFEISKVTTNSSGHFAFGTPSNTINTVLQAYKGPVDRLSVDPQNLTMQDLRDFFNSSDYNGSFYMPSAPTRAEPGDTNLTLQVREVGAPTSADLDRVEEAWEWLQGFLQNHSYAEALRAIDERLQDVTDGELRDAYDEMYNMVLENQDLEQRAEDLVEENDQLEDSLSEMEENLNETAPEDLREAIRELEQTLAEQASSVPTEEEATEIAEDLLSSSRSFDTDLTEDSVMADIRFANGSSARLTPDSEFMSIEDGGLLGGDVAVIEDYPVGESAALAVRWHVVTEDGVSKATDRATNPSFGGTVPKLEAIDVSSLAPGPGENVRVDLHPSDGASYGQIESLTVHDPGGSELATTIVDGETAEFSTSGAGLHDVDLTFSDADGQNFTTGFQLIAEDAERPMDPGIRVRESIVGTYALTGDGLDGGSVDLSEGGSTVDVSGRIAQDAEVPGTVHVYGHGTSLSPDATTRISVLRGEAGRTVSQHVRVVYHSPSIGVDGLAWRRVDGEDYALTTSPTQHGQLDRSAQNATIQTVTADNGRVGIRTLKGPGRVDRLRHWVELRLQGLPDVGSFVPSIGAMFIFGWTRRRRLTPEETR